MFIFSFQDNESNDGEGGDGDQMLDTSQAESCMIVEEPSSSGVSSGARYQLRSKGELMNQVFIRKSVITNH